VKEQTTSSFVRERPAYDDAQLMNEVLMKEAENDPGRGLFFTSKPFKRRNEEQPEATSQRTGAMIPPPDLYGPSTSKSFKPPPPSDVEDSITAGLKFLREQVDKGNKFKFAASNAYTNDG